MVPANAISDTYAKTLIREQYDRASSSARPDPKTTPDFLMSLQYIKDSTVKRRKKERIACNTQLCHMKLI